MRALLLALLLLVGAVPALAVDPDEILDDPALEERARDISAELRCLVCQNQSIDDSDAPLARDLRLIVRERLVAGDDDAEVMQFVVDRYGEFVRLSPVLAPHTVLLWAAGPLLLLIGVLVIFFRARRRPPPEDAPPLTEEERAALEALEAPAATRVRID
ncbi:MAG TPA: cytochrome c-type biogenesis protein [Devosiaceae bacterium]|jgi:cytochrome c-type biogenesis protein CcmH|nr:cytochrome c-type biogenesis protein [Devosiaceae bacterium]